MYSFKSFLTEAKLSDYAHVSTNMKDADFWIVRRGSRETIGKPVKEYNPEHIGVKVHKTDVLHPQYLFYAMHNIHSQGKWHREHSGTTNLVNITAKQIKDIGLG